jgi:hypothetical protein
MAKYAKTCTDSDYADIFNALRDDLSARGSEVLSGEYGAGVLSIQTTEPLPQETVVFWSLTEVT